MGKLRNELERRIETFLKLVQRNDLAEVKKFISDSPQFNVNTFSRSKSGDSALHVASCNGHLEMLRFLIEEHSGNIELAQLDGKTPLHDAVQCSRLEIVRYLIQRGANIRAVKKADWTPLMLACTKDNVEVVQILLAHGADPGFRNKDGWNSLHIAAREGHVPILTAILTAPAARLLCSVPSKNGRTPLHTSVMHGHVAATELLLGQTPVAQILVNTPDSCNTTPLMDACRFGHVDIMELLIGKYGADLSVENTQRMNCLHIAAEAGQLSVISSLVLNHSLDVNCLTRFGLTPLHFATRENQVEGIRLLMKLGASPNIRDKIGHTCIDLARTLKKTRVLELFETDEAS